MFNNQWLYPYNANLQSYSSFNVFPVGKIEEVKTIFPDLQGKPLFFFDQSRNEFFVKQRNVETGEVQILRYTLSNEPIKTNSEKDTTYYDEQLKQIKSEINRLSCILSAGININSSDSEQKTVEKRKVVMNNEQPE